jgi:hypothetical protein
MTQDVNFISALGLLTPQGMPRKAFELIADRVTISGWNIARSLDVSPKEAERVLKQVKETGVVQAEGTGSLEGYYMLSPLGFQVRRML